MPSYPYRLDRIVIIEASRDIVFSFLTESARWAAWWGAGSSIDPRKGGQVLIRHPNGVETTGEVLDLVSPDRIVFTYGYASGTPIPAGGSRVTIELDKHEAGTRLHLCHEFADETARDHHVQGWRYQLSVFANLIGDFVHTGATSVVDRWFAAWSEPSSSARAEQFAGLAAASVRFRDKFSLTDGLEDLVSQVGAFHHFMPGIHITRVGDVHRCQGHAVVDWVRLDPEWRTRAEPVSSCSPPTAVSRPSPASGGTRAPGHSSRKRRRHEGSRARESTRMSATWPPVTGTQSETTGRNDIRGTSHGRPYEHVTARAHRSSRRPRACTRCRPDAVVGRSGEATTPSAHTMGRSNLQGIWPSTHMVGVPFERPDQFGNRLVSDRRRIQDASGRGREAEGVDVLDFDITKPPAEILALGDVGNHLAAAPLARARRAVPAILAHFRARRTARHHQ